MSNSWVRLKRTKSLIVGYVCSECDCPVVTVLTIEAEGAKAYQFAEKSASNAVEKATANAIEKEIKKIENCYSSRCGLTTNKVDETLGYGYRCSSQILDLSVPCPNCGSHPEWTHSRIDSNELQEMHFPRVFNDFSSAEKWAFRHIESVLDELSTATLEYDKEVLINNVAHRYWELDHLEREKNSLPDKNKLAALDEHWDKLIEASNKLGLFDFSRKREITRQLEAVSNQRSKIKCEYNRKVFEYNEKIRKMQILQEKEQIMAFGYERIVCKNLPDKTGLPADIRAGNLGNDSISTLIKAARAIAEYTTAYVIFPKMIPVDILQSTKHTESEDSQTPNETSVDDKPIYCRKCGFKLISDSCFCSKCGAKI